MAFSSDTIKQASDCINMIKYEFSPNDINVGDSNKQVKTYM